MAEQLRPKVDWWGFLLAAVLMILAWISDAPKAVIIAAGFIAGALFAFCVADLRDRARALAKG
jgi:chromate transport protein ChrA